MITSYHTELSSELKGELRSSHAGEMGAVFIYVGILCGSFDPEVRAFAREHLETERHHLSLFEERIHVYRGSLLLPLWIIAGFITGFLPALFGKRYVFHTIRTVETFVSIHYLKQIRMLRKAPQWRDLTAMLEACREDELAHRADAAERLEDHPGLICRVWLRLVAMGSAAAVAVAKVI